MPSRSNWYSNHPPACTCGECYRVKIVGRTKRGRILGLGSKRFRLSTLWLPSKRTKLFSSQQPTSTRSVFRQYMWKGNIAVALLALAIVALFFLPQDEGLSESEVTELENVTGITGETVNEPVSSVDLTPKPTPEIEWKTSIQASFSRSKGASHFSGGNDALEIGEIERAIRLFTMAIQRDPQHALAYNNRGVAYQYLGMTEEAESDFKKARELGVDTRADE